ncbi:class I SAM-dependent methyltransferase [Negadavirga shengliensis]|uniref:Class I SAM-dependent methyltransferase n=1 Tax=Negadavirga shengliensis TaxID=1389218 RepID=A0ABV9SW68_9BACT
MREIQHTTAGNGRKHLPPAGKKWLLGLYDPLSKLFGVNKNRRKLIELARLQEGHKALDIGCGTGTLILNIKQRYPDIEIIGLDPDSHALALARWKAKKAGFQISLDKGFSDNLPYPDLNFDRVFSSFMLHHLDMEQNLATLREALRVLKLNGVMLLVDFDAQSHDAGKFVRHGRKAQRPSIIEEVIRTANVPKFERLFEKPTIFGTIGYYLIHKSPKNQ